MEDDSSLLCYPQLASRKAMKAVRAAEVGEGRVNWVSLGRTTGRGIAIDNVQYTCAREAASTQVRRLCPLCPSCAGGSARRTLP
jgi:hypothetical protein